MARSANLQKRRKGLGNGAEPVSLERLAQAHSGQATGTGGDTLPAAGQDAIRLFQGSLRASAAVTCADRQDPCQQAASNPFRTTVGKARGETTAGGQRRRHPSARTSPQRMARAFPTVENYVTKTLAPYHRIWDEAMLSATIEFVRSELGIRTIYYHTFEGGSVWKNIVYAQPPRSLYTDLPRKFCFERVADSPEFLKSKRHRKRQRNTRCTGWFRIEL